MKIIILILLCSFYSLSAQNNFELKATIDNSGDTAILGYYLGEHQFVVDTAFKEEGDFIFQSDSLLDPGMYFVLLPPQNNYFQLIIEDNQQFSLSVDADDLTPSIVFKNSEENRVFYNYMKFLTERKKDIADAERDEILITQINDKVGEYQDRILEQYNGKMPALIVRSNLEVEIPEYKGEDAKIRQYKFYKRHFFDHIDLSDPRLLRTPFLHQKVEYYMDKLTIQHPDSIIASVIPILDTMKKNYDVFRYYMPHFLNKYASSKIIGMDAVFVALAERYYNEETTPWLGEEDLVRIQKNARALKPTLIGKTAPDIIMQKKDGSKIRLHQVEAPYTLMIFWAPDCGHCKKKMPNLKEIYSEYAPKGLEIFAVCTKLGDKVSTCWEMIEENGLNEWINVVDPYLRSRFKQLYNIKTTPQIFLLDENKEIILKQLSIEQLSEVLEQTFQDGKS